MKIASLFPAGSEIICNLGLSKSLIAVSHECDFPPLLSKKTKVTKSIIPKCNDQNIIDQLVKDAIKNNVSLYQIDNNRLLKMNPDLIITQGLCEVCSISENQIQATLKNNLCTLSNKTKIMSLNATTFDEICEEIIMIGKEVNKVKASDLKVYGRLISYVFPYLPQFLISILGFAVFAGSQVAFAEWLKRVIDYTNNPTDDLRLIWPILLILIALVRGISFFIGNYLLASISNRLVHELRTDLFNKIPVLPSSFFDTRSSGHLVSRITFNVMQVTGAATSALKILIREGLLVIGLVSYLMFLNFQFPTSLHVIYLPILYYYYLKELLIYYIILSKFLLVLDQFLL